MNTALFASEPKTITLYDWQAEAVEALRANIRNGVRNQILASPTGSGKTLIAAYLIDACYRKHQRAVFVCDRENLIQQTSDTFDDYGIPHGIIQADHWRTDSYHRVQVATAQTLTRRNWPDADLIVVDEAHTLYKDTIARIQKRDCVVIGLTATPFARGMGRFYDAVVTVRTLNQLTTDGYLAPFEAYAATEPDMRGAKTVGGEWTKDEAAKRSLPIIGDAVAEYLEKTPGKKFIAFGVTIAHCEELQKQFLAAGVQCALYTSNTPSDECAEIVQEFRKPDSYIRGLVSVAKLSKGFDVPSVEVILMCRPLRRGFAEHLQILGRGLRRDPDNPSKVCTVLDLSGNMLRFWPEMVHFFENGVVELDDGKPKPKKTAKEGAAPEPFKCPKCAHVHPPRQTCPHCGHTYPRRNTIEHLPGKLVALGSGSITSVEGLQQDVYSQLLYVAQQRGWKDGAASHRFKALFGRWPDGLKREPRVPTQKTLNWIRSEQIRWAKSTEKTARQ